MVTATYKFFRGTYDKKTKAPQYVTYTCSTMMIPTALPDAETFTGCVPLFLPPVAATGFPGFCENLDYPFTDREVPVPSPEEDDSGS